MDTNFANKQIKQMQKLLTLLPAVVRCGQHQHYRRKLQAMVVRTSISPVASLDAVMMRVGPTILL